MNKRWLLLGLLAAMGMQAAGLEFDVVSVKPSDDGGGPGMGRGFALPAIQMGAGSGGRFVARGLPLRAVILLAYGVQDYQLSGGPGWLMTDRFDIEARPEAGFVPTEEQSREMLRAMLEDRFGLKVRHEIKNGPVYNLVAAKGGAKLKRSADQTPPEPVTDAANDPMAGLSTLMSLGIQPSGPGFGPGGGGPGPGGPGGGGPGGFAGGGRGPGGPSGPPFAQLMGTSFEEMKRGVVFTGPGMFRAKAVPLTQLIRPLMGELRKPIVDKTGLAGLYDMELTWTPAQMAQMLDNLPADIQLPPGMDRNGKTIFQVLEAQLGLKLEQGTGPIEAISIEKVEKPTAN